MVVKVSHEYQYRRRVKDIIKRVVKTGPRIEKTGGIFEFLSNLSTTFKMATFGSRIAHVASEGFRQGLNRLKMGFFRHFSPVFAAFLQNPEFRQKQKTSTFLRVV